MEDISCQKVTETMCRQSPLLVSLLWSAFLFQDVVDTCERPTWTRVGLDMTLQDVMSEEQSQGIQSYLYGMGLSKECLDVLNASCKMALLIAVILSLFSFLPKRKTMTRKGVIQAPVFSDAIKVTSEQTHSTEKMLFRLMTNTSKMMKYMKHIAHHYKQENRYHKLSRKKKTEDMDDGQLFPVCSHHHRSSGDSDMD